MEATTFIVGLAIGLSFAYFRQIRGYFKSKVLIFTEPPPKTQPSRILRPFTAQAKRKPRVNDDSQAWLVENKRT